MATKTFSASVDAELLDRVRNAAEREGRSQSGVVAAALELYTALDPAGQRVLAELARTAGPSAIAQAVQRVLFRLRWSLLAAETRAGHAETPPLPDAQIIELADAAVRETRSSTRAPSR